VTLHQQCNLSDAKPAALNHRKLLDRSNFSPSPNSAEAIDAMFSGNRATDDGEWDREVVILGRDDVSDFNEDYILPLPDIELAKVRTWLQPTKYDHEGGEFKKHLASHLNGTGDWLFATDAYRKWHSSQDQGLLWIRGIPGSGKSVFAASIADRLRREGYPVLYFFFRQIIDANHSPMAAVRDWLDQLLVFSPPLQAALKGYVDEGRDRDSLSISDLCRHIRQASTYLPKVYCVVDALDEMDQNNDLEPFLRELSGLASWRPSVLKIVATSRPVTYIERPMRAVKAFHIRLEEKQVDIDIATFVQYSLGQSSISARAQAQIRAAVPGRANGLFLYAKLAMEAFLQPGADTKQVLEQLPQDLNVMYADLLREHASRSGVPDDMQLLILQSVTHASRPLRLLEIAEFVNVTQGGAGDDGLKAAKDLVRKACGPLLEILPDETVSVVHYSLTEFLNGSTRQSSSGPYPILEPGSTHERLALICLSYLLSGPLDQIQSRTKLNSRMDWHIIAQPGSTLFNRAPAWADPLRGYGSKPSNLNLTYPFLDYAAKNWHVHTRKSAISGHQSSAVNTQIDKLLSGTNLQKLSRPGLDPGIFGEYNQSSSSPLMAAVKLGLTEYVKILLGRPGTDIEAGSDDKGSPLCVAAAQGYEDIVGLLLKAGANVNVSERRGYTPLHLAAISNRPGVAKILVDSGVNPFQDARITSGCIDGFRNPWQESPAYSACRNGHMAVLDVFFPLIKTSEEANGLLRKAVMANRPEVVMLALRHPMVDVNTRLDKKGSTALIYACMRRSSNIIRLLLQAGADPNVWASTDSEYDPGNNTPLHALVDQPLATRSNSHEETIECFELLLGSGADAKQLDSKGNSLLHNVADPVLTRLLLDAGADPNTTNKEGETVLHNCDNEDVLRVILADTKTDLESKTKKEELTPLLYALQRGKVSIALILLEVGASPLAVGGYSKNGVFHLASQIWCKDKEVLEQIPHLIRRLRERGGDPNATNRAGETALHLLVGRSNTPKDACESILRALVEVGANLEARDNEGRTPFFRLASSHSSNFSYSWDTMLSVGAKLDTVDFKGRTLFHRYDHYDERKDFLKYVEHGLDPKKPDYEGNTLWHMRIPKLLVCGIAAPLNPGEAPRDVQMLIELDVDIRQANHAGRTPLHLISTYTDGRLDLKRDPRCENGGPGPETERWATPLEYIISHYAEHGVDQTDHDGVTALHLASTHCEYTTRLLLRAGANPMRTTSEGLTPLHLAARSRQPHIIATLLNWIKTKHSEREFLQAVNSNTKDYNRWTPLQFACTSGHSESVRLLLEAGASDVSDCLPKPRPGASWYACAGFEAEDQLWVWEGYSYNGSRDPWKPTAGGVLLNDKGRPKDPKSLTFPTQRLEEIIDMLAFHMPPTLETIDGAIQSAARQGADYAVECLIRKRKALFPAATEDELSDFDVQHSVAKRNVYRELILRYNPADQRRQNFRSMRPNWKYEALMKTRDYELATEVILNSGGLDANEYGYRILRDLVVGGFAALLKKVATKKLLSQLDDWGFRTHASKQQMGKSERRMTYPLLLEACHSGNMEVLRVLVEDLGADVNIRNLSCARHGGGGEPIADETALHVLSQQTHGWQVTLGISYLIKKGANLEIRDGAGFTPLLAALGQIPVPSFKLEAIEALVAHGADVNVIDPRGHCCLTRATGDIEVFKLLLRNGAEATGSVFTSVIEKGKIDFLEALLQHGGNPNIRRTEEDFSRAVEVAEKAPLTFSRALRGYYGHGGAEVSALLYPLDTAIQLNSRTEIVEMLLNYGANPNAAYDDQTTIMHRVMGNSRFSRMFINLPGLDIETRCSRGCTLLHTVCMSASANDIAELLDTLLNRGADICAKTNDGLTALHCLIMRDDCNDQPQNVVQLLRRTALAAPGLVNTQDNLGRTPLHLVLTMASIGVAFSSGTRHLYRAEALLSLGADHLLPDAQGNTPLHLLLALTWKIDKSNKLTCPVASLFNKLIALGVDVNARNAVGETPLFSFFRGGKLTLETTPVHTNMFAAPPNVVDNSEDIRLVLWELFDKVGMNFQALNDTGESLLHAVVESRVEGSVTWFKSLVKIKGLDPLLEDKKQRTPLDVAAAVGAKGVLALFKEGQDDLMREMGGGKKEEEGLDGYSDDDLQKLQLEMAR